jgi:hypothetical protein
VVAIPQHDTDGAFGTFNIERRYSSETSAGCAHLWETMGSGRRCYFLWQNTPTYAIYVYIRTTAAAEANELNAAAPSTLVEHFLSILFDAK